MPVRRKETQGRAGKHPDGIARTREAKLGALFTQITSDAQGNPVREAHSTTYVGKIESVNTFGPRLFAEAARRGVEHARRVVEAGCRSLIGERLKCSGMHWSVYGANAILALRCCLESNRFEDYWEQRRPDAKAA